ncbi:MAG: biopolymer transporter ExbD [Paracoccus sp. (in: a-proteobacteria)]|nr:biopolymer transporter ExbD [Paracoccus sp. (in: a-proteobacteria)]
MQIDMPPRRPRAESIIPMINVVFLLLVFFLLTAQIAPPVPFEVEPPESAADEPALEQGVLYVSATGELAYDGARGDAVWPLITARGDGGVIDIRADRAAPGSLVAAILRRVRQETGAGAQLVISGG